MELEIRALGPGDDAAVVAAQHLFDGPAKADATARSGSTRRTGAAAAAALVEALGALARQRGCTGMFVLVDDDNEAGRAVYRSAGGAESSRPYMVDWSFVSV